MAAVPSPVGHVDDEWVDGLKRITDELNAVGVHTSPIGKDKFRAVLEVLQDPPRSWEESLDSRAVRGRDGVRDDVWSLRRSVIRELAAGDHEGLVDEFGFHPPAGNLLVLPTGELLDHPAVAQLVAERDRLRARVAELDGDLAVLKGLLRDQARHHAHVVEGLT